ncbi:MAG: NUDIX hydrolase [Actinomycetaceae bacterium]|nr:NUDIX hydrolase [Actinomycetaceae bacterium]
MAQSNSHKMMAIPRPPRHQPVVHFERAQGRGLPVVEEQSAGGLVLKIENGRPLVAVIARRNRAGKIEWCLPKGHIEPNESTEVAAIREIAEETGITGKVITPLADIDYWFSSLDRRVHKIVYHFLLEYESGEITVENDPDHEAEDAAWYPLKDVSNILAYPNERRVVAIAMQLLYPDSYVVDDRYGDYA